MPVGTTALILGGLAAAKGVSDVIGARQGAKGARDTANFQASQLDQQAQDALLIGDQAANRTAQATRALTSGQRVSQAASGVDVSSGSAADVISSDERLGAMDVLTIRNNAAREALGLKTQANLVRMGGQNQAQGYRNQATGSLLSGAADLYDKYQRFGLNRKPIDDPLKSVGAQIRGYGP
ncbi:MAG: hypothetical protein M3Z54_07645 [Gemmatimonadota bacterium]|nr:hypothetical protein [Gemmatimonadota bacterium]